MSEKTKKQRNYDDWYRVLRQKGGYRLHFTFFEEDKHAVRTIRQVLDIKSDSQAASYAVRKLAAELEATETPTPPMTADGKT